MFFILNEMMNERGTGVNVAYGIIAALSLASNLLFCLARAEKTKRLQDNS